MSLYATDFVSQNASALFRMNPFRVDRTLAGLSAAGLIEDLERGPFTLLAPVDHAYEALPWSFDALLRRPDLVEPRFDLFEYMVVPGRIASGPTIARTLEGAAVLVGATHVLGRHGSARIVTTVELGNVLVHVLDACLHPHPWNAY